MDKSKTRVKPGWINAKKRIVWINHVVLLLLTFCLLLRPVIVLCFVVRYIMSILVLQSF